MSWRVEALWKEAARPGLYSREGGEPLDFADVQEFPELDDAKRFRAQVLQSHPQAVVAIEPVSESRAPARRVSRPAGREEAQLGLKRMRHVLEREGA